MEASMARKNTKAVVEAKQTHEGAPAYPHLSPLQKLRRSTLANFLWEDTFYEDGEAIADRIRGQAELVTPDDLAALAIEARKRFNMRHVPLLLLAVLARRAAGRPDGLVRKTIATVISRADELSEFLTIYWAEAGRAPNATDKQPKKLAAQVKKGLAEAFRKFDAYGLSKYNRDTVVKLRDVMFLVHPKAKDAAQEQVFKALAEKTLESPDTWEVALSGGADKLATWERLLEEGKLGYLALLRNLRNMVDVKVNPDLIIRAIRKRANGAEKVLPFRFVAAAKAAPQFEPELDKSLVLSLAQLPPMHGKTIVLVDVSGSMDHPLSAKSDMHRIEAAAALAAFVNGDRRIFTFSMDVKEVPPRPGMAGVDAIINSQAHSGTDLRKAFTEINKLPHDRLILITDEQTADAVAEPVAKHAYLINVATFENGVGYGPKWVHISGFSEHIFRYIAEIEAL